jgi:acyl-ACP thioesterase
MKVELKRQVRYGEVDPFFRQKIGSLFKLFTDAAVRHSESAGFGPRQLIRTGHAWVLNKFSVRIHRYPEYGETLRVLTWHRGQKGVRAYREFEIFAGNQRIAAASSVWLYIDMQNKKILRLPETVGADYTVETESALGMALDGWKGQRLFPVETHIETTIRRSDYDPVGHVNNAAYLEYLETSVLADFGETARIITLNIEFLKEIDRNVRAISTGMKDTDQGCLFKISDDDQVYACGELTIARS